MDASKKLRTFLDAHPRLCQKVEVEFDIGNGAGAWYVGQLLDTDKRRVAGLHVVIWDRSGARQEASVRKGIAGFMRSHDVHEVMAEIPEDNVLAQRFAKRVGLRHVGKLYRRPLADGSTSDMMLYKSVKGEL